MIEKMRKNILGSVAIAAVAALSLASCNKSQPQVEAKSESKAPAELKIAYVEVDSIMTQYTFAKEYSSILEKKGQNIQATIAQKGQQLQAAAANFQQKIQQNAYTREQAEAIHAGLQKQNNDLQGLQQRLSNEFAAEQEKYNKALHDSIANYLARYNKGEVLRCPDDGEGEPSSFGKSGLSAAPRRDRGRDALSRDDQVSHRDRQLALRRHWRYHSRIFDR